MLSPSDILWWLLEGSMLWLKGYTVILKKKWTQRFLSCTSKEFNNSLQTRISSLIPAWNRSVKFAQCYLKNMTVFLQEAIEAVVTCTFILSMPIGSQYKKSKEHTVMNEKIFSFDGPTCAGACRLFQSNNSQNSRSHHWFLLFYRISWNAVRDKAIYIKKKELSSSSYTIQWWEKKCSVSCS